MHRLLLSSGSAALLSLAAFPLATRDAPFPVLVWDLDLQNQPVAATGIDAATKHLDGLLDGAAKGKATIASKITSLHADCHSPELGYATLEFGRTVARDGRPDTSHCRATALVAVDADHHWHVFHWHASIVPPAQAPGK